MSSQLHTAPPDQDQRDRALDPRLSVLVQAPAGSGKTDLLTRRFLRLLSEVDDPSQIVAITFTKAAAAEMRHRIVSELEKASAAEPGNPAGYDEFSMESLAWRALQRSRALKWNVVDLPVQLRISTIDSFCRELALQQPLLAGLGGGLDIDEQPHQHYRRAARRTLEQLGAAERVANPGLQRAIETLLLWRDNNWQDLEGQLVEMLEQRDRWMRDFVIESEQDWEALRERLERPFARAVSDGLARVADLLGQRPGACSEAMELARFACANSEKRLHKELAELAEFPCGPFTSSEELESARQAYIRLAQLLLTVDGAFRQKVDKRHGFPADRKREKQRLIQLAGDLSTVEGLKDALAGVNELPPARYTEDDWNIVRACFVLLRRAAAELKVIFAEAGTVDYVEVAQLAQRVLEDSEGMPTDAALDIADGIKHLLVDEFQDTSRRQHKLIASLVAAWPDTAERTVFVVGDPMQSIYFFRDADAELFPRARNFGLDLSKGEALHFEFASLTSNFRTAPQLVESLNQMFASVFAIEDGSQLGFSASQSVRPGADGTRSQLSVHLEFVPQTVRASASDAASLKEKKEVAKTREVAQAAQTDEMVSLIRDHLDRMERARTRGEKYRIAILGRTRTALSPIALALRNAAIPFRAVDLEPLAERPEILDVLALARALFNGEDRVAWLGVLRAPWCGLSLKDLHTLTSADDPELLRTGVPEVFSQRLHLLSHEGQRAVNRVVAAIEKTRSHRLTVPTASAGTWLKQVWEQLGGAACVDATALTNLDLLWKCIDTLPGGEPDLLGDSLSIALKKLTAQPDPAVNSECGVQLMTIHKSKGLEFELVIVPELQAGSGRSTGRMLTWLERGLAGPDDSGAITEFLIAPIQPKGSDRGRAKAWVDKVYRARERQEIRRILYVAGTRAREELHLFARPEYKEDKNGERLLCQPSESLLSSAWPAFENEIEKRFDAWTRAKIASESVSLAAGAASNLIEMPSLSAPSGMSARVRRLPLDYEPPSLIDRSGIPPMAEAGNRAATLYMRHEGGMASRALGSAVHSFLEEQARLRITLDWNAARKAVEACTPRVAARIRAAGIVPEQANKIAEQALGLALRASHDLPAEWILSPHLDADREARWTGMIAGTLRTVQADVVFRAGDTPESRGDNTWWIIDYKTSHAQSTDPEQTMRELRPLFAPQLEIYAQVLRNLHGAGARIHAGLYYPRMLCFDWWEI